MSSEVPQSQAHVCSSLPKEVPRYEGLLTTENPYDSPAAQGDVAASDPGQPPSTEASCLPVAIGANLGGLLGILFYVLAATVLESYVAPRFIAPDAPRLSYGMQAALVMTPLAGMYGVAIGAGLALCLSRNRQWGASVILLATLLISAIVGTLWQSSVARYGRDISELILYAPFLFAAAPATIFGLACLLRLTRVRARPGRTGSSPRRFGSQM